MSSKPYRVGQWIPSDQKVLDKWLDNLITEVKSKSKDNLALLMAVHPPAKDEETARGGNQLAVAHGTEEDLSLHLPVQELLKAIISDPEINMFFQMFWQQYKNPDGPKGTRIPSWQLMIISINHITTTAPEYNKTSLVGFPINVILNRPMATNAGFAAFLNNKVNSFKSILNYWGKFISSSASCYVLTDHPRRGWFGGDAMQAMPNFVQEFQCKPNEKHYGFTS